MLGAAVYVGLGVGKEYPQGRVDAWCEHAHALKTAKMLDRAYAAFRRLERADACEAADELADLRFYLPRRAQLLEAARSFRRAAALRAGPEAREARRDALSDAFSAYLGALELDPFASGGRRGFSRLVATYRRIDPQQPDCTRGLQIATAGLVPEGRLHVSRALRTGNGDVCRAALTVLGNRRAAAYGHLRVAQAREAAGDDRGARAAYAAALRADSAQPLALRGLDRVEPPQLRKEGDERDAIAGFFADVVGVVPPAVLALLAIVLLALWTFAALWFGAREAGRRWPRVGRVVERIPVLRGARQVHVQLETPADLPSEVKGLVDGTLANMRVPPAGTADAADVLEVSPAGASIAVEPWQVEGALNAVPPLAAATQLLRLGTTALQEKSDVGLVLDSASAGDTLEQRWRVIDRHSRATLKLVEVTEDDLVLDGSQEVRERFFALRAGQELRTAIEDAQFTLETTG